MATNRIHVIPEGDDTREYFLARFDSGEPIRLETTTRGIFCSERDLHAHQADLYRGKETPNLWLTPFGARRALGFPTLGWPESIKIPGTGHRWYAFRWEYVPSSVVNRFPDYFVYGVDLARAPYNGLAHPNGEFGYHVRCTTAYDPVRAICEWFRLRECSVSVADFAALSGDEWVVCDGGAMLYGFGDRGVWAVPLREKSAAEVRTSMSREASASARKMVGDLIGLAARTASENGITPADLRAMLERALAGDTST